MKHLAYLLISMVLILENVNAQVLFEDDFNDGDSNGWLPETYTGNNGSVYWTVQNGKYVGTSTESTVSSVGNTNWTDYVFEVDVNLLQGIDTDVFFRMIDKLNHYDANLIGNQLYLGKRINGTPSILNSAIIVKNPGKPFRYKVVLNGANILIYLNETLEMNYTDSSPFIYGKVGVAAWSGNIVIEFDNVNVYIPCQGDCPTLPALEERVSVLENKTRELEDKVNALQSVVNRTQSLENRIEVLEGVVASMQSILNSLQGSLNTSISILKGYLSNLPLGFRHNMICYYMKQVNVTNYSDLGLKCEWDNRFRICRCPR